MIELGELLSKDRSVTTFKVNNFILHVDENKEYHIFESEEDFKASLTGSRVLEVTCMSLYHALKYVDIEEHHCDNCGKELKFKKLLCNNCYKKEYKGD